MSDDSITSIEHHAAPQDWVVPPTAVMAPARTNGVASPNENGHGPAEEISVFNGDDNHKVWANKDADMTDGIYGDYGSTMRSFRSSASGLSTRNRPRQMMMQSPPPPPIPEELVIKEAKDENKKKKKKSKSRDVVDGEMMPPLLNGSVTNLNGGGPSNGSVINGGRASSRKMSAG